MAHSHRIEVSIVRFGGERKRSRSRIVFLGSGEDARCALTASDENLPAGKQSGGMAVAGNVHHPGGGKKAGYRIVNLGLRSPVSAGRERESTGQQHLSAIEKRSPVIGSHAGHIAGRGEKSCGGIVKLGGGGGASAAGDQHFPAREQRRGMTPARKRHASGGRECAGQWIVKLGGGGVTARYQNLPIE